MHIFQLLHPKHDIIVNFIDLYSKVQAHDYLDDHDNDVEESVESKKYSLVLQRLAFENNHEGDEKELKRVHNQREHGVHLTSLYHLGLVQVGNFQHLKELHHAARARQAYLGQHRPFQCAVIFYH